MLAGIYIRVAQAGDRASLEMQETQCRQAAEQAGYEIREEFVWREHWSGIAPDGPRLNEARQAGRSGVISVLFVFRPDRLSRDQGHLTMLLHELRGYGVRIQFVEGYVESATEGPLLSYIKGHLARLELDVFDDPPFGAGETAGRPGRADSETNSGRSGHDCEGMARTSAMDGGEAAAVPLMFRWASEGVSAHRIASRLNRLDIRTGKGRLWNPRTVRRILRNNGFWHYRLDVPSSLLISPELFGEVGEGTGATPRRETGPERQYVLTGFSECLKCGSPLLGASFRRGRYRYYRCRATVSTSFRAGTCDAPPIPANELEDVAWRTLAEAVIPPAVLAEELLQHSVRGAVGLEKETASLKREILVLGRQQDRLLGLLVRACIDQEMYQRLNGPLRARREEKERALRGTEERQRHRDTAAEIAGQAAEVCREALKRLYGLDIEAKRATFAAFGARVRAASGEISLTASYPGSSGRRRP